MNFKKIISAFLLSSSLYSSSFAQDTFPLISDVARQVRKKEAKERTEKLLSIPNYIKAQIQKPEITEIEPVEYFCRNLLVVFGIGADSYLSDIAVRQLRRKIVSEAESRSNYFNEIGLKLEKPLQINFQNKQEIREVSKIEYNVVSGLGIKFKPSNESVFETKLAGSADPFRLKATPKIKAELRISDYLEFYGEARRTINREGIAPLEYEYGFNFNVLNWWAKYHSIKERKPLEEVLNEFRKHSQENK